MIKAAWELFKGLILLGVWILLAIVMMIAAGFSFLLNIITIPIYLVCCIVAARKQAVKPRVGYLGLTIYPTRKVTPDTSSPKEFLFLLGAVLLFLFSVLSFCNDFPILGCILLISAIIIWSKYAPKRKRSPDSKPFRPAPARNFPGPVLNLKNTVALICSGMVFTMYI